MQDGSGPRPLSHVGLTVSDLEAAVEWYGDILGFETLIEPHVRRAGDDGIHISRDLLGVEFESMRVAFLETGGGANLELFEFDDTEGVSAVSPVDVGFHHVGVVDPDLEALAARIDETGGEHYAAVWELYPGFEATYCWDPWRNRIEIYNREFNPTEL